MEISWLRSGQAPSMTTGMRCPAVVPGEQDNVVIPATASIMPEMKTDGQSCKSVTLEPGATLTIKPGYVLTVNGREVD
jgi:hypothetical protein